MVASRKAKEMIKKFEGLRLKAYKDSAGVRTIGYGHAHWKGADTISLDQADYYLDQDIKLAERAVNKYSKYNFNQNQFDALVSFAFNIGSIDQLTNYGVRSIQEISDKIKAYNKAGGKVVQGLVTRRAAEWELFNTKCDGVSADEENKPIKTIIDDVIAGKYGNGEQRKEKLYNYIQGLVNQRLRG